MSGDAQFDRRIDSQTHADRALRLAMHAGTRGVLLSAWRDVGLIFSSFSYLCPLLRLSCLPTPPFLLFLPYLLLFLSFPHPSSYLPLSCTSSSFLYLTLHLASLTFPPVPYPPYSAAPLTYPSSFVFHRFFLRLPSLLPQSRFSSSSLFFLFLFLTLLRLPQSLSSSSSSFFFHLLFLDLRPPLPRPIPPTPGAD